MPIIFGMDATEADKELYAMAKKGWTTGMVRMYLDQLKKSDPVTYNWLDPERQTRNWARTYGFKEGPAVNEFGEVCP